MERYYITAIIVLSIAVLLLFSAVSAQEGRNIPQWVRNTAKWWSAGTVSDSEFLNAIQYLVDQDIIKMGNGSGYKKDSVLLPSITTDKRTYQIGEEIKISGSGFEKGTIGLLIGDDRFSLFVDKSKNLFSDSQASELGDMIKYPLPDPVIQAGQWKEMNFNTYGTVLKTNIAADLQGTWQATLQNSNLTSGHYEIRVAEKIYNGYNLLSNSSQTFLLKTAKTDFFIQ